MRISVAAGMWSDRAPEEAVHTGALADRLGFEELWLGETGMWDAFTLATAIGLATDRIAMTAGPLAVTGRSPIAIATGAASVAALIRRPIGVALATPIGPAGGAAAGSGPGSADGAVHDPAGRTAADVLADRAGTLAALLAGDRAHGDRLRLAPPGGPFTVAALGDRAIAVAAAHADRMVANLAPPAAARRLRKKLDAAAAASGRPAPRLAIWLPAAVDPEPESYAQLIWHVVPYLALPGYREMFAAAGFGKAVRLARDGATPKELLPALPLEVAGTVGLSGDAAAVRARLAAYEKAGVDEIVVAPVTGADPGGERTLTAIRELGTP